MDESANKGLESKGSAAVIRKCCVRRIRKRPSAAVAMDKGLEGLELNGSDAAIQKSRISRMVVEGYDISLPRDDVEGALRKHFASCGIKLIHAYVPFVDDSRIRCRSLIYVNEECEAEALKLDGSDMGGRILHITAYPFDKNHLEHIFSPTVDTDKYRQRTLRVAGFDTSQDRLVVKEMVRRVFPQSACSIIGYGLVSVYLHGGQDAIDKALKLSGDSVGGVKIAVKMVLPKERVRVGVSREKRLAMVEIAKANQKMIMATDL